MSQPVTTALVRTAEQRLWGHTVRTTAGVLIRFEPVDDDGTAGVREPRRPKPAPPSLRAEAAAHD